LLFGGFGNGSDNITIGNLNDLWQYDGFNWTWVGGSTSIYANGNYGTQGIPSSSNIPSARVGAIIWVDLNDIVWLFGGFENTTYLDYVNDLWKYDGYNWTWVGGSYIINSRGNYGIQGIPSALNIPSARNGAMGWVDSNGTFWMFGGEGFDVNGRFGNLNDFWKFDGFNWTWVSGDNTTGSFGSLNTPSSRCCAVGWTDNNKNFWIFGGAESFNIGNDLWKLNLTCESGKFSNTGILPCYSCNEIGHLITIEVPQCEKKLIIIIIIINNILINITIISSIIIINVINYFCKT